MLTSEMIEEILDGFDVIKNTMNQFKTKFEEGEVSKKSQVQEWVKSINYIID